MGLRRPTAGLVEVLGQPVARLGSVDLARLRRQLGYVPQALSGRSNLPLTTREVVAVGRTGLAGLFRRLTEKDWGIVDVWLARLGLGQFGEQPYYTALRR